MSAALITKTIKNIFHVLWFYNLVLEPKHSKKKLLCITITTALVYQLLLVFAYGFLGRRVYGIAYVLTAVVFWGIFLFFLSASPPAKSTFLISAYYCLWTFIYVFISIVTGSGVGAGNWMVWGLRIGLNLFFLLTYLLFFKKKLRRIYREMQSGYGMTVVISCLTFVIMTALTFFNAYQKEKSVPYIFLITLSYLFMLIIYVLLFYFMAKANHAYQFRQIKLHERLFAEQINTYEQMEQNERKARRDFRHHNMVVMELAEQNNCEGILAYLREYERIEDEKENRSFSANYAVNSLVSAYVKKAEQSGIKIKTRIRLKDKFGISDVDLVSVLANMMDNALKGCMEAEEHWAEVIVQQKNSMILLACKNACADHVLFCDGLPCARDHEGIGVEGSINTAEKYDGSADFYVRDGAFICRVLLNGRKKQQIVP